MLRGPAGHGVVTTGPVPAEESDPAGTVSAVTRRWPRVPPLWRRAPLRGVREAGAALLLATAVAVLVGASVSAPLLVESGGDAALQRAIDAVPAGAEPAEQPRFRAAYAASVGPELAAEVEAAVDALPGLGPSEHMIRPVLYSSDERGPSPLVRALRGTDEVGAVGFFRDGAVESLRTAPGSTAGGRGAGVWLPEPVATRLGVGVGDTVELLLRFTQFPQIQPAPTLVDGVYPVDADSGLPAAGAYWRRIATDLPRDPADVTRPAALVVAPEATLRNLLSRMGELPLESWDARLSPAAPSPAQARATVAAITRLTKDSRSRSTPLGRAARQRVGGGYVEVISGLPQIAFEASRAREGLRTAVAPLVLAGQGVGVAVVGAAAVFASRRRRREVLLLHGQGAGVGTIGALRGVESLLPALVGAVLGWCGAFAVVGALGPGRATEGAVLARSAGQAVGVAVAATVLVGLLAVAAAARETRAGTGRAEETARRVPWVAVLAAVTVAAGVSLATGGGGRTDVLQVAFPLLALATTAVLLLRPAAAALPRLFRHGHDRPPRSVATWLAARRLGRSGGGQVAVAVVVATALGFSVYTVAVAASLSRAVDAKGTALAGARSTTGIQASWQLLYNGAVLPTGYTRVWRDSRVLESSSGLQPDLLAVDPATFPDAALWDPAFGEPSSRALMDRLATPFRNVGVVPVILVDAPGEHLPGAGTLRNADYLRVRYRAVARLKAFPGLPTGTSMVVIDKNRLFPRLGIEDPTLPRPGQRDPDGVMTTEVWSRYPADEATTVVRSHGGRTTEVATEDAARNRPELLAVRWSVGYLVALGVAGALLAVATLLLYAQRGRAGAVVAAELLRRMGLSPRGQTVASLIELVALAGAAALVGVAAAAVLARALVPGLDQSAGLLPRAVAVIPAGVPVSAFLVAVAGAAAAAFVAQPRAGVRVGEAFRVAE